MHDFTQGVRFGDINYGIHTRNMGFILERDDIQFPQTSSPADNLTGYGNINAQDFNVVPDYTHRILTFEFGRKIDRRYPSIISNLTEIIHGRRMKVVRDCEADKFYIGRCEVTEWRRELTIGHIVVKVDAEPYAYGTELKSQTMSGTSMMVNRQVATLGYAPCIVTITPKNSTSQLVLTGLARDKVGNDLPITINNLSVGKPVIIDGYERKITEGSSTNKFADCTMWAFPTLKYGLNAITASNSNCTIKVDWREIYI